MFLEYEDKFNTIYKEARMEARKHADAAVREYYESLDSRSRLVRRLWQMVIWSFTAQFWLVFVATGFLSIAAFAALQLMPDVPGWIRLILALGEIIANVAAVIVSVLVVVLSDWAIGRVTITERRVLTANFVVSKWLDSGLLLDDLSLAYHVSTNALRSRRRLFSGAAALAGTFLNLHAILVGDSSRPIEVLASFPGAAQPLQPMVFLSMSIIAWVTIFIAVSAPLNWREQLEPFLTRAMARARNQDHR